MTDERWEILMWAHGELELTKEEFELGWHYCPDWDGLLIGPGMRELECCTCKEIYK